VPMESQSSSLSSLVTATTPGVSADSNGLFHGLGDHASNSFSVDGQAITDQQSKVFSNQIPSNSIQSIQVISGAPPAEYGDKTSLVIVATTRSGQGVSRPTGAVTTAYVSHAESQWTDPDFHIEFARETVAGPVAAHAGARPATLELTIVHGSADKAAYSLTLFRIDLGRCAEVRDSRNRLIRTNHVAFADGAGDLNQSVSRRHAHIEYAAGSGDYRVYDDRSAHGTGVLRDGRTMSVPPGSRGIRLQTGDEIVLGEARLRVAIRT